MISVLAATFERLLSHVIPLAPSTGPLRSQLIELLSRQAFLFVEAPLHVTTPAWLALGPASSEPGESADAQQTPTGTLRIRVIDQHRQPFEAILQSSHAREELDDFDIELAMCNSSDRWFSHE